MVVDEAHGFAVVERLECAKNGSVTEPFGNATGIKAVGGEGQGGGSVHGFPLVVPRLQYAGPSEAYGARAICALIWSKFLDSLTRINV
jgi:hypothetical protein